MPRTLFLRLMHFFKYLFRLAVIAAVFFVCISLYNVFNSPAPPAEPDISSTFINNKLQASSQLTSAEMIYNGIIEYKEGNIPFINQKAFLMTYRAQVEAGIKLEDISIRITDEKVVLTIPKVEIQNIIIDTESIKFYDETSSLFNQQDNEDVVDAIEVAKEDVKENGDLNSLKKRAKDQIKVLMNALFEDVIGERTLIVEFD